MISVVKNINSGFSSLYSGVLLMNSKILVLWTSTLTIIVIASPTPVPPLRTELLSTMSCTVTVVFPNDVDAKYDIDYYVKNHMTLIEKLWSNYGLKRWSVTNYVPGIDGTPPLYSFGSEVVWENEVGMKKAFESSTVAEIMADVAHFSNKPPIFLIGRTVKPAFNI